METGDHTVTLFFLFIYFHLDILDRYDTALISYQPGLKKFWLLKFKVTCTHQHLYLLINLCWLTTRSWDTYL